MGVNPIRRKTKDVRSGGEGGWLLITYLSADDKNSLRQGLHKLQRLFKERHSGIETVGIRSITCSILRMLIREGLYLSFV